MAQGLTLHIGTDGYRVPSGNAGSNPLSIGSGHHLGPDLGLFGIGFTIDTGVLNFSDIFDANKNPLLVQTSSATLQQVSGECPVQASPLNLRIRIEGVCFKVPVSVASRIRSSRRGKIFWRTTRGSRGSFRLAREAPAVFL